MAIYLRLYPLYTRLASIIRTDRGLFKLLYGHSAPDAEWGQYWDWTTVLLLSAFKRHLTAGADFLDLGCGPYAVIARHVYQRYLCHSVTATDHAAELLDYARANDPQTAIRYLQSDLFANINGSFDLIAFNAPYIDIERGTARGLFPDALSRKRFCGGKDGVETIQRFLNELPVHLKINGKALLGVNHFHISEAAVYSALWKSPWISTDILRSSFSKSSVYVLQRRADAAM